MKTDAVFDLVDRAVNGDGQALEEIVLLIQDKVYNLALRMLSNPEDARDATQEILVKVITNLSGFRKESALTTWVFSIASRHLLTARKSRAERLELNFSTYGEMIDYGCALDKNVNYPRADERLIVREIKIMCMYGMLLCLSRMDRIAFILSEVFDVSGVEGSEIMNSTPAAYRQRVSRSKRKLRDFMDKKCGLFNPDASCRCEKQIVYEISIGRVRPDRLVFSEDPPVEDTIQHCLQEINALQRLSVLFRSHPDHTLGEGFAANIRNLIETETWKVLQ
ncbi:MAG: RNA polymerase sigma factor [Deltaproteobacteria bacterium]|nr:RNA polymerase sigma factor [Candidatus Zymogenaceae bacterium]